MKKIKTLGSSNNRGEVTGIVFLGGGQLLRKACLRAKLMNFEIKVITSKRQSIEFVNNEMLVDFLIQNDISYCLTDEIRSKAVERFLGNSSRFVFLSIGAPWKFKLNEIKFVFEDRLFNLHGSRLPQNRGGGGFSWQILMGNKFGFCAIHRVSETIDEGEIIAIDEFLFPAQLRKPIEFENFYVEKNLNFLSDFFEKLRANFAITPIKQSEYFSTYWPRLNTEINGWINWTLEPIDLEKFICAFDEPYAGALTMLNENKVRIKEVCLSPQDGYFHPFQSGIIYRKSKSWICVAIHGSTLVIEKLYDNAGRNILDSVNIGDRFFTPHYHLDTSLERVFYNSKSLKKRAD